MPVVKIAGVPSLDGEYELDVNRFTNLELHIIKQEAGVRAGEIEEAWTAKDNDVIVAFVLIALRRAGKGEVAALRDSVWEADTGSIKLDLTREEREQQEADEKIPPASEPEAHSENETSLDPSGSGSPTDSAQPANGQSLTGIPA